MSEPIIFQQLPEIPSGLSDVLTYQLRLKEYKIRSKTVLYIFLEIIGTILILGLIWFNVDWIRLGVTKVAIMMVLILLLALTYVL